MVRVYYHITRAWPTGYSPGVMPYALYQSRFPSHVPEDISSRDPQGSMSFKHIGESVEQPLPTSSLYSKSPTGSVRFNYPFAVVEDKSIIEAVRDASPSTSIRSSIVTAGFRRKGAESSFRVRSVDSSVRSSDLEVSVDTRTSSGKIEGNE